MGAWPTYIPPLAEEAGKDLVVSFCQVCHSTTYITMQPPLPAGAWEATLKKMINDFGAAIPEESARQIVTYLQAHYAQGNRKQRAASPAAPCRGRRAGIGGEDEAEDC